MTVREATDEVVTPWRRFVGANIKGTPAMSADKVGEDVEVLRGTASIIVTQETRWAWYWKRIGKVLAIVLRGRRRAASRARWKTSPTIPRAIARPLRAAASVMWKGRHWKRARTIVRPLHKGAAKISETRWARAVLLVDWDTLLALWVMTAHFVVGADARGDSDRRRKILLEEDFPHFAKLLDDLVATGHPVIGEIDANIGPSSAPEIRARFLRILEEHGARIYGDPGVEWLFVINGAEVDVEVRGRGFIVRPKHRGGKLNTDHEARGITFRLVRKGNR